MRRKDYFGTLLALFSQHIEATDERTEYEIQEKILTFIEENEVPAVEEDLLLDDREYD